MQEGQGSFTGEATDMYESQDSVQGQAHRSPECGTSIVLGSGFRS